MCATDKPLLACQLDGSRMSREVHVRFCERLAVTFRGPTLPGLAVRRGTCENWLDVRSAGLPIRPGEKVRP